MGGKLHLIHDEAEPLTEILARISARAGRPLSLGTLLHGWESFVARVEQGYSGSIYDYVNELSERDLLQEILASAPTAVSAKIMQSLHDWDERFRAATTRAAEPLLPSVNGPAPAWWWFRVPNVLSTDLRDGFAAAFVHPR